MTVSVKVLFFASLSERLGIREREIDVTESISASAVWHAVIGEESLPSNVLVAINQEYASAEAIVADGDEVAFFPPVTGG